MKLLLLYVSYTFALFLLISHPQLDYLLFGGKLGLFGNFSSLAFYNYHNASQLANRPNTVFAASNNASLPLFSLDGQIDQLLPLSDDTFLVLGNFTEYNNKSINSPFIYNVSDDSVTEIISTFNKRADVQLNGTILTSFVDNELIYFGGDFEFNSSYGAAVYNQSSQTLSSLPFRGFGQNSSVNAISKIFDETSGSIIFGGHFDTLGFPELLVHNVTTNRTSNNTNLTSLITAEQQISLKHGIITTVNTDSGDPKSLICPRDNGYWSVTAGQGGEWAVELPDQMKGLTPSKARLYIPDSNNSIQLFRIYSYPNSGIMNLSYIDPNTNEMAYCDAWCPLLTATDLQDITLNNMNDTSASNNETTFIDDDGSFISYYNSSTRTRTLGYGASFQEFAFVDQIPVDKVGLTVIDWYGSHAASSGFELYTDSVQVYGNDTLNEPNCDDEDGASTNNLADIIEGTWESILVLDPSITGTDYQVSSDSVAQMVLYPNISYSGIYSMIITTPGCVEDKTCDFRSIVNVTLVDGDENILASQLIYQNNNYDKFDYLYYGHLNGSVSDSNKVRVEISHVESINANTEGSLTIVDNVIANIVELDDYLDANSTNSTKNSTGSKLSYISLNGLFEYSLDNFTDFNETKVFYKDGNMTRLNPENTYIGNSSINLLSGSLSSDSSVEQIQLAENQGNQELLVLGTFDSDEVVISNNNLITLNISSYNDTSNEAVTEIVKKRTSKLIRRADGGVIYGASFSSQVDNIYEYGSQTIFLGDFTVLGVNGTTLKDLSNGNQTIDLLNNIAIYSDQEWFGLGNNDSVVFTQFTNITIGEREFSVYSSNSTFMTWDNLNSEWVSDPSLKLQINQAITLGDSQIIGGESFKILDYYGEDQTFIENEAFNSFSLNVTENSPGIEISYYINETISVIGGKFNTSSSVSSVGFIHNGSGNAFSPLSGNAIWSEDNTFQTLYSSSDQGVLYFGINGSVAINDNNYTGVIIYDLLDNAFRPTQPARLSNNDESSIDVNAIVQYDDGAKLLVGGNFDKAGSFDCDGLCVYDLNNTRWTDPAANSSGNSASGVATDIRFFSANLVFISGNLSFNNAQANFVEYDFDSGSFDTRTSLNLLGSDKIVNKFIIVEASINTRMVAYGDGFISGFDGSKWGSIDQDINFDSATQFKDIRLLDLAESNNDNDETYFNKNQILVLVGRFELADFGLVNAALYNGTSWIPYVYSVNADNEVGQINTILINDRFSFLSSQDIKTRSAMATGKVVGISLACALGSTTLLGLLYLIPYLLLFKKLDRDQYQHERIDEKDQMEAVNPEDLLYEMDLQRNH